MLSGFDLQTPELPDDARVLQPPLPLPGLDDFRDVCFRALEEPLDLEPLASLVTAKSRVCVVIDDPSFPVPQMRRDCRREMLEAVLQVLSAQGLRSNRVTVLLANGLNRQWRNTELTELLGVQSTASFPVICHDAEERSLLRPVGDGPSGPLELNRAVVEADLVVHLNVVSTPVSPGWYGLVSGVAGYRTARQLNAPALFEQEAAPLLAGSSYQKKHDEVGAKLAAKTKVVQLTAVLNNELWASPLAALLQSERARARPVQMWNAMPSAVRHRAARLMKASYRPIAAFAGSPGAVAPRALEAFYRQHEIDADGQADIVVCGLPDIGPYAIRSQQNPVLAAHLALFFVSNMFTTQPLLKPGGALVFANPLEPKFDARVHSPHQELYEKVLRTEREPTPMHERFEAYFAGRPEFVSSYQRRFAFHGTHPLYLWYQTWPARKRIGKIIVAHGDPRSCARLGFMPAADVEDGLTKAREYLGASKPKVTVLALPPPFFVRVKG